MILFIIFIIAGSISLLFSFLIIKKALDDTRKESMTKIDFSKDKNYYRDIIKEYSPAELSFVDDFKVNNKREIVSTLLALKLKKRIEITENEIIVNKNNDSNLKNTEQFILNHIKDGRLKLERYDEIEKIIVKEALKDKLVEKLTKSEVNTKIKKKKNIYNFFITILFLIILVLIYLIKNNILDISSDYSVFKLFIIFGLFFGIIYEIKLYYTVYSVLKKSSYKRTEKGEKINEKLEGLKKYISDYSLLSEKEKEALEIWDEYLIYSVIFDINKTNIVDELNKLIDLKYEPGKIYFYPDN